MSDVPLIKGGDLPPPALDAAKPGPIPPKTDGSDKPHLPNPGVDQSMRRKSMDDFGGR